MRAVRPSILAPACEQRREQRMLRRSKRIDDGQPAPSAIASGTCPPADRIVAKEDHVMRLRHALWEQLDPSAYEADGISPLNKALIALILFASTAAILETEPVLQTMAPRAFASLEQWFAWVFLIEYLARLWVAGENPRYAGIAGGARYLMTPAAILDLAALLPSLLIPGASNLMLLRMFRLLRILRLARMGRFSLAMHHMSDAISERKEELLLSLFLAGLVLVFSAAAMYVIEGETSPDAFGSIPRALWWSVCALTTVGYGDVHPITPLGKICAGLTSLAGIGLIAMPTGILAAAFSDAFHRTHRSREREALSV
jgi:voltage-gated potassium channel